MAEENKVPEVELDTDGVQEQSVEVTESQNEPDPTEIKKEVLDSEGKSKDPKEYESYDQKQWNDVVNSADIKAWPTE